MVTLLHHPPSKDLIDPRMQAQRSSHALNQQRLQVSLQINKPLLDEESNFLKILVQHSIIFFLFDKIKYSEQYFYVYKHQYQFHLLIERSEGCLSATSSTGHNPLPHPRTEEWNLNMIRIQFI